MNCPSCGREIPSRLLVFEDSDMPIGKNLVCPCCQSVLWLARDSKCGALIGLTSAGYHQDPTTTLVLHL